MSTPPNESIAQYVKTNSFVYEKKRNKALSSTLSKAPIHFLNVVFKKNGYLEIVVISKNLLQGKEVNKFHIQKNEVDNYSNEVVDKLKKYFSKFPKNPIFCISCFDNYLMSYGKFLVKLFGIKPEVCLMTLDNLFDLCETVFDLNKNGSELKKVFNSDMTNYQVVMNDEKELSKPFIYCQKMADTVQFVLRKENVKITDFTQETLYQTHKKEFSIEDDTFMVCTFAKDDKSTEVYEIGLTFFTQDPITKQFEQEEVSCYQIKLKNETSKYYGEIEGESEKIVIENINDIISERKNVVIIFFSSIERTYFRKQFGIDKFNQQLTLSFVERLVKNKAKSDSVKYKMVWESATKSLEPIGACCEFHSEHNNEKTCCIYKINNFIAQINYIETNYFDIMSEVE